MTNDSLMKVKSIAECCGTKLFHFHGIFYKNEIKSANEPQHIYAYKTLFQKSWVRPCFTIFERLNFEHLTKLYTFERRVLIRCAR